MHVKVEHDALAPTLEDSYPLSPMQQGMLFNALLDPGSGVDVEQLVCELRETLDVAAFQRAWRCVVARHAVLRTSLRWEDLREPLQEVHAHVGLPWEEQDWSDINGSARDRRLEDFLAADRRLAFRLTRAPLFRLTLLRHGEAEYHLIWTFHHVVLEGRSYTLLLRELFAFYEAFRQGKEIALPQPRPYRDYIDWVQQQNFTKSEAFWREKLKGFANPTPLARHPALDTRKDRGRSKGILESFLSTQVTSALRALATANQLTLSTIIQGAWAILLSRYSGESDVVFGVIRANRRSTIEGADRMVGLFLNTLPLRVRINSEALLIPLLKEVRREWNALREHEHTPLAMVQSWSELAAGVPLFQSTVMFENGDLNTLLRREGEAWSRRHFRLVIQTNYPLDLAAYDGTELRLTVDFDRNRIDEATAGRLLAQLRTLLEALSSNPDQRVADLPLLDPGERHRLLYEWNDTATHNPPSSCIHGLFEAQAARTPEATAVAFDDRQLTYRELNRRSNQLAHHLRALGVGPDVLVCICAERSLEMVVGLLGILKAGGAYVPIDPTYPAERVAFMLSDAGTPVVVAQGQLMRTLPALTKAKIVGLDDMTWDTAAGSVGNPTRNITNENLAYVIYTSGSTGRPKGAMIPHRAILNHLQWMQSMFPLNERDCVLQKTEFSFDVSVWEFFAPLMVGARLVVASPGRHHDPAYLADSIVRNNVTVLQLVPSHLRALLESPEFGKCSSLRHVFCGGEAMPEDIPQRFFETLDAELHNMYGPTEVAIDSTCYSVPRDNVRKPIPIGRPVANTQAYVLDPHLQPVPAGVPGELYLGGVQVFRGYHNQPEQTAKCLVPDPFSGVPGARLYRTGDRARFLSDGNIEYLGRVDHQVKIRGFRVEAGEVESALMQYPAVRGAVVVSHDDVARGKQLVAYVTGIGNTPKSIADLRGHLTQRLPSYMVPAAVIPLDEFPVTPNGKVDRSALPSPRGITRIPDQEHVAPRTPIEEALAASWCKILELKQVGIHDNFFDLGGHSLLAIRLVTDINWRLRCNLGVSELFRSPTVGQLADVIGERRSPDRSRTAMIHMRSGRAEPFVYFIYTGADEFRLASLMGDKHPVFGIESRWQLSWRSAVGDNKTSSFPDLQRLAAQYASALVAHSRNAPCVLVGHSFAGLIAFEAAHQFHDQGGKLELVILLDTWVRQPTPFQIARHKWRRDWKQLVPASKSNLRRFLGTGRWLLDQEKRRVWSFFNPPKLNLGPPTIVLDEDGVPLHWGLLDRLYGRIEQSYRPRRLDCRGVLIRTDPTDERQAVRSHNPSYGWNELFAGGLEIVPMVGDHLSMLREHTPLLARNIDTALERHLALHANKR